MEVSSFDGSSFLSLSTPQGGLAGPGSSATTPGLLVAGSELYTYFSDGGVWVTKRNATNDGWDSLDGPVSFHGNTSSNLNLLVRDDGEILLGFNEYDGTDTIGYVARFTGTVWEELGSFDKLAPPDVTSIKKLVLDDANNTTVIWLEGQFGQWQLTISRGTVNNYITLPAVPSLLGTENVSIEEVDAAFNQTCGTLDVAVLEKDTDTEEYRLGYFRLKQ